MKVRQHMRTEAGKHLELSYKNTVKNCPELDILEGVMMRAYKRYTVAHAAWVPIGQLAVRLDSNISAPALKKYNRVLRRVTAGMDKARVNFEWARSRWLREFAMVILAEGDTSCS
jgi:hypothetical protein